MGWNTWTDFNLTHILPIGEKAISQILIKKKSLKTLKRESYPFIFAIGSKTLGFVTFISL